MRRAAHFPVYAFNPSTPEENLSSPAERDRATDMLRRLALDTGGLFITPGDSISGFARVAHDTESDYSLTYESPGSDMMRHQVEVRVHRRDAWVRTRTMVWPAPSSYWRDLAAFPPTVAAVRERLLRRSRLIDVWVGVRRERTGAAVMTLTWEPRAMGDQAPAAVVLKARDAAGSTLFEGSLASVGELGRSTHCSVPLCPEPVVAGTRTFRPPPSDRARFTTPGGRVELDLTILDSAGIDVDHEARDFDLPDLKPAMTRVPRLLPPEIVRVQAVRELQSRIATDATPSARRSFARTDQLLVRTPAFDPTGLSVRIAARLLSRSGQSIRDLESSARIQPTNPDSSCCRSSRFRLISIRLRLWARTRTGRRRSGSVFA
jgi:hypothetical protein